MSMKTHLLSSVTAWFLAILLVGCGSRSVVEDESALESSSESSPAGRAASPVVPEVVDNPTGLLDLKEPPRAVVRAMLELAAVRKDEQVVVLGCGDGGIGIGAARDKGARVVVVDSSPEALGLARENARRAGVAEQIEFRQGDVLQVDLEQAQVVLSFLNPALSRQLGARVQKDLLPGTRFVSWITAPRPVGMQGGDEGDEEGGSLSLYKVPAHSHPDSLAPYVQTPLPVVRRMLDMASVTKDDVLYDLGCGDGRIVIEAAKRHGTRGVGVDFDIRRIREARENAQREGVAHLVEFHRQDIQETDCSEATVVTLFLLPISNDRLRKQLGSLRPGTRILSHSFDTKGWRYRAKETVTLPGGRTHTVYFWVVGPDTPPEPPEG